MGGGRSGALARKSFNILQLVGLRRCYELDSPWMEVRPGWVLAPGLSLVDSVCRADPHPEGRGKNA